MIKFLVGSCLSGLGVVMKEPLKFNAMDITSCHAEDLYKQPGQVLSLRALIHEFFQQKI